MQMRRRIPKSTCFVKARAGRPGGQASRPTAITPARGGDHYARGGRRHYACEIRACHYAGVVRTRNSRATFARPCRTRGAPPATYETIHTFRYHTMEFVSVNHYLQLFLDYFVFHGDKTKKIGLQTTENKGYYRNNEHSLREATDRFSAHFEPFLPSSRSLFLPCWVY